MLLIPAQIEKIATRKDKTWSITIGTQELTPDKARDLAMLNQSFVYVAIKTEEFRQAEEELLNNITCDVELSMLKTPSQRLRAVFYKLFSQDNKGYSGFQSYYEGEMEKLIDHFKSKIE